jgi:FkbM family methyltransferase
MKRDVRGLLRSAAQTAFRRAGLDVHRAASLASPIERDGILGLFHTALGPFWLPLDMPDDVIVRDIRAGRVFEADVVRALSPFLRKDTAAVDVGANFGQMSLAFADAVGPSGEVHAIEANPAVADICAKNIAANSGRRVLLHRAAAWSASGAELTFPEPDFDRFSSLGSFAIDPTAKRGVKVASLAVDDIAFTKPVSVIKVDVQGADLRAMQGARKTIARDRPAMVFEFEQQFQREFATSFQDYADFVASIGYRFHEVILGINFLVLPKEAPKDAKP